MTRTRLLMEIYQGLWLSADFENDLEAEFPTDFKNLKYHPSKISDENVVAMYEFMRDHPVFN